MTDQEFRTDPPESYPTFWDAIAVDVPVVRDAAPPAGYDRPADGPAVALYLERGDV